MSDRTRLDGRVALVTGAGSPQEGIGWGGDARAKGR